MPLDPGRQLILRWTDPDPQHLSLLSEAGIEAVLVETPQTAFERACAAANIIVARSVNNTVTRGLWPGIRRDSTRRRGSSDETASASREPWVDANGYLVACERALNPQRPAVLGYHPQLGDRMVPFETLEVALAETRVNGGNYILSVEPRYREALLKADPKALAAWKSLGQTARWLRSNASLFSRPTLPTVTVLVEPGGATSELVNLLFRRGASPAIAPASNPPPPHPKRILTLVACSLKTPSPEIWKRIHAHAEAGSTVVIDSPPDAGWKVSRKERDRSVYSLGRGSVVAYEKRIADPSEFALDVIDIVNHRNRAVRLWNASPVIPLATEGVHVHLVNYGSRIADEFQCRVQGYFSSAQLLRPSGGPLTLKTAHRGSMTEVFVPEIDCVATIRFA